MNSLKEEMLMEIIKDQIENEKIEDLHQYLKHNNPRIRAYLIETLADRPSVTSHFITGLACYSDISEFLKKGIQDVDKDVRLATLNALGDIRSQFLNAERYYTDIDDIENLDEATFEEKVGFKKPTMDFNALYLPLIYSILDTDSVVQYKQVELLEEIGDPFSLGIFFRLLKTADEHVCKKIEKTLSYFVKNILGTNNQDVLPILLEFLKDDNEKVRFNAVKCLSVTGENGYNYLLECLKDKEPIVRSTTCETLAGTGDPFFLSDLLKMTKDPIRQVRDVAFKSFNELNDLNYLSGRYQLR